MTGEWLTTGPNPRRHRTYYGNDGCTGWRLHFVPEDLTAALCGLRAKHGWSEDLFIDMQCIRCANALDKIGLVKITDHRKPHTHYSITNADTHKNFWSGANTDELLIEAKCAIPASAFYLTEWFGLGDENDEIIEQLSVDEWLLDATRALLTERSKTGTGS